MIVILVFLVLIIMLPLGGKFCLEGNVCAKKYRVSLYSSIFGNVIVNCDLCLLDSMIGCLLTTLFKNPTLVRSSGFQ